MKPLYIFDLDGTLADASHRQPILEDKGNPNRWRDFYAECHKDKPIWHVIDTMDRLSKYADIFIFSGRSDEVRNKTVVWLVNHTFFMEHDLETALVMRRAGDHRPDDELKREFAENMLAEDQQRLVAVFDDRDRVVKMWRSLGIPCFQVAPGDF